jgi:hypothetical protein
VGSERKLFNPSFLKVKCIFFTQARFFGFCPDNTTRTLPRRNIKKLNRKRKMMFSKDPAIAAKKETRKAKTRKIRKTQQALLF